MRAWVEKVYGIPPEQVVGSSGVTRFELRPDGPVLLTDAKFLATFKDYPPSQRPSSFSIDQLVEKVQRSFETR